MSELGYLPCLAISRAITADELKWLDARPYKPFTSIASQSFGTADSLEKSPYGFNSFTHTVVTWEDEEHRTILGFDPYGVVKQEGIPILPSDEELKSAMQNLAGYVIKTMALKAGVLVQATPIELR
mgnify:CR=1 FL=1